MAAKVEATRRRSAIIIGAGIGGTATAARLAKRGFDVKVYEKNDFSGGRLSLIYNKGHRFDQGPSLYLMPKLFEEVLLSLYLYCIYIYGGPSGRGLIVVY